MTPEQKREYWKKWAEENPEDKYRRTEDYTPYEKERKDRLMNLSTGSRIDKL